MKVKNGGPSAAAKINALRKELIALRAKRGRGRSHPTEKVWEEAMALCRAAPVSVVASGIGVSEQGLRNRLNAVGKHERGVRVKRVGAPVNAAFMEIAPEVFAAAKDLASAPSTGLDQAHGAAAIVPLSMPGTLVELERRDGLKLRLQLPSQGMALPGLLGQFMGVSS